MLGLSDALLIEIIKVSPNCFIVIFALLLLFILRNQISSLLKNVTKFSLFGLEAEFGQAKEQLQRALNTYPATINTMSDAEKKAEEEKKEAILKRAKKLQEVLTGARILWIDDMPLANANIYRFLNDLGIVIDSTKSTREALAAVRWSESAYEAIVSDMYRAHETTAQEIGPFVVNQVDILANIGPEDIKSEERHLAGLVFIYGIRKLGSKKKVILFVANPDLNKDTPRGAVVITHEVDILIHSIFDEIEKNRRL
jgi:hypothetical protein